MNMETNKEQVKAYFGQAGFQRLFLGLKDRYYSLGHMGGTVVLENPSLEEVDILEGFLQKDCHKPVLRISVAQMEKALLTSKFSEWNLLKILKLIYSDTMTTKKELVKKEEEKRSQFFQEIEEKYQFTKAGRWFSQVLESKRMPYSLFLQEEKQWGEDAKKRIFYVLDGLNQLPIWKKEEQWLPVFSSKVTGDPHYFDEKTRAFRYLCYGICSLCEIDYPEKMSAEAKTAILYQVGILKDDISNFVTCIGIQGTLKNGSRHEGIDGFYKRREMIQLNLFHLGQLAAVEIKEKNVYVVENPSVFQQLAEQTKGEKTIVCSYGQLRLAVVVLLDLLVDAGCTILYSGDFDPEGLLIAQKLKDRYDEHVVFWHYERKDYEHAKSKKVISKSRLEMLKQLTDLTLKNVGIWLTKDRVAGYQENLCNAGILQCGSMKRI